MLRPGWEEGGKGRNSILFGFPTRTKVPIPVSQYQFGTKPDKWKRPVRSPPHSRSTNALTMRRGCMTTRAESQMIDPDWFGSIQQFGTICSDRTYCPFCRLLQNANGCEPVEECAENCVRSLMQRTTFGVATLVPALLNASSAAGIERWRATVAHIV